MVYKQQELHKISTLSKYTFPSYTGSCCFDNSNMSVDIIQEHMFKLHRLLLHHMDTLAGFRIQVGISNMRVYIGYTWCYMIWIHDMHAIWIK